MWNEEAMAFSDIVFVGTEETRETPKFGYSMSQPRLKPCTQEYK
jgi:hypothetical protein